METIDLDIRLISKYDPVIIKIKINENVTGNDVINIVYNGNRDFINYMLGKTTILECLLSYNGEIMNTTEKIGRYIDLHDKDVKKIIDFTSDKLNTKAYIKSYEII